MFVNWCHLELMSVSPLHSKSQEGTNLAASVLVAKPCSSPVWQQGTLCNEERREGSGWVLGILTWRPGSGLANASCFLCLSGFLWFLPAMGPRGCS